LQTVYYIVLVPMLYTALAVFVAGSVWRTAQLILDWRRSVRTAVGPEKNPGFLLAAGDSCLFLTVARERPVRWLLLLLFHAALLLLLLGHAELIADIRFLQIVRHEVFLGGGVVGIVLFVGALYFLCRRFHAPLATISQPGDYYLLILFLLVVLFGSQLHLARRFFGYTTIGVDEYREYLVGIFTFRPALPEVLTENFVGHSFLLVLHVLLANLLLILFPWSKLMHALFAIPLARLRRR